ncbi:Myrcene synthase, chloroplastic [Musa troglodytarum]|uniref:Myrcene synthase, chloroplastic n=1 Tax=Musa troglodytarum TaxID=320322 RepID=A0A9E7GQ18_9LILI|nr:Myrcene synthase, chloroplastic [Musa troglodytarum]
MDFTTKHLKNLMEEVYLEPPFREHVAHALEHPLNWRMERIETRWFIEACQRVATVNPLLLELAKLDFNLVQSIHKRELGKLSSELGSPDGGRISVLRSGCHSSETVFNMTNDARIMKEKGSDIIPYLKRAYMEPAGIVPTPRGSSLNGRDDVR